MTFFSYERILRGVLTWRELGAFSTLLCFLCMGILLTMSRLTSLSIHICIGIFVLVPLAVAALIDSACHILPDPFLFFATVIALFSLAFVSWREIGVALGSSILFLCMGIAMSKISSLGLGDAKLMAVLGLWLGAPIPMFMALMYAFCGAGAFALILLARRQATLRSSIALGPWLIGGGCVSWCLLCFA